MKFCYLDESGTGSEPYAIMASIIVDVQRMSVTKDDWSDLLLSLSELMGKKIKEFHTRDFYSGNDVWRNLNGKARADVMSSILNWLKSRKHKVSFCGIDKAKFFKDLNSNSKLKDMGSLWCTMALHQLLITQKEHQSGGAKGKTVFIFDNEERERKNFTQLAYSPPEWTGSYYGKKPKKPHLHQLIDVPYFGDSEKIHMLQIADLVAYIVRRYAEITEGVIPPKYEEEKERMDGWMSLIQQLSLPSSSRYPKKNKCECSLLFYEYAPVSLRDL